jgi:SpoVK/Ycf46/Vps4 family AAA+-type ATPase
MVAVHEESQAPRPDPVRHLAVGAVQRLLARLSEEPDPALLARLDQEYAAAADRLAAAVAEPLWQLAARARLTPSERELLAVLVTVELEEGLQQLVVGLTGDRERHRVERWMLPHLLDVPLTLVGPASALLGSALVETVEAGAFGRGRLCVPARVLWALLGDSAPDPALEPAVQLVTADVGADVGHDAVLVTGPDRVRRRQRAVAALATELCLVGPAPASPAGWSALVREATLLGAAVVIEADGPLDPVGRRWVERATGLSWALASETGLALESLPRRDWRELSAGAEAPGRAEWEFAVGPDVERLHHLSAEQLDRMRMALAVAGGDADAAYRRLTDARLQRLARHIVPRAGWDDLVLSPDRKNRLQDFVDRYRMATTVYDEWGLRASPSRGLVALFSGPSGTGKTLGAEVIAGQLGLDLYRLDLSSVVSKYIGETEKNLDELFDAAGVGNTVLFFDEADSLFGKRTDVGDARDRYANVETSYLLQRLERYDGIVVLATNYEKNIDQAFLRRVHVRVDFPLPSESERRELWTRNLAGGAPMSDDIDLGWLAGRFDLSGAGIRNVVVDAAFLAAAEGAPIGMGHLVRGVARELHKLGRMVTEAQFGDWYDAATRRRTP